MFKLPIPEQELFDEKTGTFIQINACVLELEHSLVSLSKWESYWCKPFLTDTEKTIEESTHYIKCMTLNEVDPNVYLCITNRELDKVREYIEAPMTATWFSNLSKGTGGKEVITNELIYYWMIALTIPFECEHWHLNRLMTLIKVCSEKNKDPKKMSQREALSQQAALNAARRKQFNSKG